MIFNFASTVLAKRKCALIVNSLSFYPSWYCVLKDMFIVLGLYLRIAVLSAEFLVSTKHKPTPDHLGPASVNDTLLVLVTRMSFQ